MGITYAVNWYHLGETLKIIMLDSCYLIVWYSPTVRTTRTLLVVEFKTFRSHGESITFWLINQDPAIQRFF